MKSESNKRKTASHQLGISQRSRAEWLLNRLQEGRLTARGEKFLEELQIFLDEKLEKGLWVTQNFADEWCKLVASGYRGLQHFGRWSLTIPESYTVQWHVDDGKTRTLQLLPPPKSPRPSIKQAVYAAMVVLVGQLRTCERCGLPFIRNR